MVPAQAAALHPTVNSSFTLTVEVGVEHEVRLTLQAVKLRKAAGPDGVSGRVLRDCADQLAGLLICPCPNPLFHPA